MKKILPVLLAAIVITTALFSGCASSSNKSDTSGSSTSGGKKYKVALLLSGNLGDMSFLDSSNKGMKEVAKKYGDEVKVIEMGSDSTKYEPTVEDASDDNYDIIIGSGWQLEEPFEKVAPDHQDKKYIIFDASVDYTKGKLSNVYSINYKQNEASFLAGVMAAKMTKTNKLGFLGGMDGAVINDFLIGYIEGAKYVNKDIKVYAAYVGSYSDSAKCKEMALSQYNQGADIIFTAAGAAGLGTLDAAKSLGKYAIGVDSDQAMLFDTSDTAKAKLIPTSVMKRVDNSLVRAFDMIHKGTITWGKPETLGLSDEAVGLADNKYYEQTVPDDVRTTVSDVSKKIISGDIKVSSAFGKSTSEVTTIINSVKP